MFSFEPSDEQKLLIDAVRKFAAKEMRTHLREADEKSHLSEDLTKQGWELGLLQASIPEAVGGFGERSTLTGVLADEELAWGDLSGALSLTAPNLVAFPLLISGTEQQKREILPLFCSDSYVPGSSALMEPRFNFDPLNLSTRATATDGKFIISGTKCNVAFAAESEWMIVYAALEGKTQGFLVHRETPGAVVREREENMGMRAFPLYSVSFEDCSVPAGQRVGGESGLDFQVVLNASRLASAALAVGVARAAYEYGLDYAKNRKAFGEAIAQRQSIAFMLAEMATDLEAARMLTWEAAWMLDQGHDATRASYLAKNFADDMVLMVTDRAVQILGGHGYIRDYPVELYLRNARGFAVMEGIAIV